MPRIKTLVVVKSWIPTNKCLRLAGPHSTNDIKRLHSLKMFSWVYTLIQATTFTMESQAPAQSSQSDTPLERNDSQSGAPDTVTKKPTRPQHYKLTYTYIHYKPIVVNDTGSKAKSGPDGLSAKEGEEDSPLEDESAAAAKNEPLAKRTDAAFWFINKRCIRPIMLFKNQMFDLVDELPKAYEAYHRGDSNYRFVLAENKDNLTTLEVSLYKDKTYLFMKKYFKARRASQMPSYFQEIDENAWIPTKSFASFDPVQDDPQELFDFVLTCCH